MLELSIKLILIIGLVLAGVCYYQLPKSRFVKNIVLNETIFVATNIIGMLTGATGLAATFLAPDIVVELHLWELIVLPYLFIIVYWLILKKIENTSQILDEKQEFDMTRAGAFTFAIMVFLMAAMFTVSYHGIYELQSLLWFPFYLFTTLFVFSISTLYFFRRN